MLKIVSAPAPVLSQIAKNVKKVDKYILKLLKDLDSALLLAKDPVGVGLAAPQVGVSLQIFIAKPTPKSPILVFINPVAITQKKAELNTEQRGSIPQRSSASASAKFRDSKKLEGCLSLPNIWGEVKRKPTIKLQFQLITNNNELITKTHTFSGFLATIIQHEMDHLNGVLFPKRVLEQKGQLYKSSKNEKGEDEFEEIEI